MISREVLYQQIPHTLYRTDFPTLGTRYQGKVRDMYHRENDIILITTDRVSAFDRVLTTLPYKGMLLTEMALVWFNATQPIVANHVLAHPDPNVIVIRRLKPIRVEMVVRGHLAGSLFSQYPKRSSHKIVDDFKVCPKMLCTH